MKGDVIDRVNQLEKFSIAELMRIYYDLTGRHTEFGMKHRVIVELIIDEEIKQEAKKWRNRMPISESQALDS